MNLLILGLDHSWETTAFNDPDVLTLTPFYRVLTDNLELAEAIERVLRLPAGIQEILITKRS